MQIKKQTRQDNLRPLPTESSLLPAKRIYRWQHMFLCTWWPTEEFYWKKIISVFPVAKYKEQMNASSSYEHIYKHIIHSDKWTYVTSQIIIVFILVVTVGYSSMIHHGRCGSDA
jgi:hypothetical protein